MKRLLLALSLALFPLLAVAADPAAAEPERLISLNGTIEVGPDGEVRDFKLNTGAPETLNAAVGASIRRWRFEPVQVNGAPVIARTAMNLLLVAVPVAGGYRLKVRDVHFGVAKRDDQHTLTPPHFPEDAMRHGLGAEITTVVTYDAAGNISDVSLTRSVLLAPTELSPRARNRWLIGFEQAVRDAVRTWHIDPPETIAGQKVGGRARIPVTFLSDNTWQYRLERDAPAAPAPAAAPATTPLDKDWVALDSHFKLVTPVLGAFLN